MIPPDTSSYKEYHRARDRTFESITKAFREWRHDLNPSLLRSAKCEQLRKMRDQIGSLTFGNYSHEVNEACNQLFYENRRINSYEISDWQIRNAVDNQRSEIARQLSDMKQASCRQQLNEIFASVLTPTLGAFAVNNLIDAFMWRNDIDSLANALVNYELAKAQQQIQEKQFPASSVRDIVRALNGSDETVTQVADQESRRQLREQKAAKNKIEAGFVRIGLGKNEKTTDLTGQCFWVPASVHHEVADAKSGFARYSFFVYGGVSIQPHLNVVQGGGGPLGGNSVGGGAFNRGEITRGFQQHHIISTTNPHTQSHSLLAKAGFNIESRANRIFLPTQASQHPTRSIHRGRHTTEAILTVRERMNNITDVGQAQNWNQSQYRSALRSMLSEFRQQLRTGNIALNSKHRPWTI